MIYKVFSIFDSKSESYSPPMFFTTKGQAMRSFQDMTADDRSMIHFHPTDFNLFELGEFDNCSGKVVSHDSPIHLGCALEFASRNPVALSTVPDSSN